MKFVDFCLLMQGLQVAQEEREYKQHQQQQLDDYMLTSN